MLVNHSIVEQLNVYTYGTREAMGAAAAEDAARRISRIIEINGAANIVFAAAPSQNDLFWALLTHDIDWTKVRAFQQDEYIGISAEEPAGFGNFLKDALYDKVTMKDIYYLYTETSKVEEKIEEYTGLLKRYPIDLIFLGVGENGHLAFNDPPVADFDDPKMLKIVELDQVCRQQQVNDGCFSSLESVPTHALTLTLSFIRSVPEAICVVPTDRKAKAIASALHGPVTTDCPASMLRKLSGAALYLDRESAELAFPDISGE